MNFVIAPPPYRLIDVTVFNMNTLSFSIYTSYRLTRASIPTAAQLNASWNTLTPLWNGPAVWLTGSWTAAAPVTTKWALPRIWTKSRGGRASLSTTQSPG